MTAKPDTVIELANVAAGFKGKPVLSGVTLSVPRGELVLIEGATGAGKTTMIRLLLGAQNVENGLARVLGVNVQQASESALTELRHHIGTVFQTPYFLHQESVLTNASIPLALAGESSRRCRAEATRALMDAGLAQAMHKRPSQLSGGEQARLQIARALIHKPYLVLCDEPFAHLDPESSEAAEDLLATAHSRGTTVIITTHKPTNLAAKAKRYRLENGVLT